MTKFPNQKGIETIANANTTLFEFSNTGFEMASIANGSVSFSAIMIPISIGQSDKHLREIAALQQIEDADEEAAWEEFFSNSKDMFDEMSDEAYQDYLNGLTEDFDPDIDMP